MWVCLIVGVCACIYLFLVRHSCVLLVMAAEKKRKKGNIYSNVATKIHPLSKLTSYASGALRLSNHALPYFSTSRLEWDHTHVLES